MPVPTEQLAADIRESNNRLTDAINDLGRKVDADRSEFSAFRMDVVGKLSSIETKLVEKLGSIETAFGMFRGRTETSLSVARWAIGIAVPVVVCLVGFSFTLAWNAAKLDSLVRQHDQFIRERENVEGAEKHSRESIETIKKGVDRLTKALSVGKGREQTP
jgi:hypothetical protein